MSTEIKLVVRIELRNPDGPDLKTAEVLEILTAVLSDALEEGLTGNGEASATYYDWTVNGQTA